MSELEFLCLGVSRSMRGHYAAGIDLATGDWVRLVSNRYGSALGLFEPRVYVDGTPRRMKPLDVVSLNLDVHVPKPYQPHNWTFSSGTTERNITYLRNAAEDEDLNRIIRELAQASNTEDLLFGSETSEMTLDVDGLNSSLCVVHSKYLYWRKTSEFNKGRDYRYFGEGPSIKGDFKFGACSLQYGLPLADVAWGNRIKRYLPDAGSLENNNLLDLIDPTLHVDTFLTVSFDDDVILDGCRYKFIAGVLLLPELKGTHCSFGNLSIHNEA